MKFYQGGMMNIHIIISHRNLQLYKIYGLHFLLSSEYWNAT